MSWQFRKSKKIGPIRLTASKRGISTSIGSRPFRVTRRADGGYQRTIRIPGTGIRNTTRIGSSRQPQSATFGGFGVGFILGWYLFLPLLIIVILFLWFAAWQAVLFWGLVIVAIILTRRYRRHQRQPAYDHQLVQSVCQILDAGVEANGTLDIKGALNAVLDANPNIKGADAGEFVGDFVGEVIGTYRRHYVHLVPRNAGAIAEDAFRERVFLQKVAEIGVTFPQPLDQARVICQVLDTGVPFTQMCLRVVATNNNNISQIDAAKFVGTVIAAYRPDYGPLT